jgi:hypothetical protein
VTFDKFRDSLPALTKDVTLDDKAVLRQFLQHPCIITVLAAVMFERSHLAADLLGADLKFYDSAEKATYSIGLIQGANQSGTPLILPGPPRQTGPLPSISSTLLDEIP